ncbi:undecaprenyl-phosphate glucose phosphotransferase [Bordetella sp. FB-8]|uniref:undecaprenyl-phosphate glucose phosphotransferase n=1 Tax=Bordetella sp. FB-8 TaxID=1159870 RepID=UPI00036D910E|nr:undecaprenyl-phosphate glucose phosphotransferase [Bordetella sp. FB-8]
MLRAGQLTLHYSALMVLIGLSCALCNVLPFYVLSLHLDLESLGDFFWIRYLIFGVSFMAFANFRQLITARNMWWLLGRGIVRWIWVLLTVLLSLIYIVHDNTVLPAVGRLIYEWMAVALPLQLLCLALGRRIIYQFNNTAMNRRKAVFFGMGPQARTLSLRLRRSPILGIEVMGYYAAKPVTCDDRKPDSVPPYLGAHESAWPRIKASEFDIVFIQPYDYYDEELSTRIFGQLYDSTTTIYMVPETRWAEDVTLSGAEIAGIPLLSIHDTPIIGVARLFKRLMDLVLGGLAFALLSPVMLIVAVAVRIDSRGPILFRQVRYGERGQSINVYKFRSMYAEDGGPLRQVSRSDPRVTRVGKFLRRSSLDELPQLINVLAGSMSLVGPRPHAVVHNELYRQQINGYMLRHSIKPGITGWAQVNGLRGETDTLEKMQRRLKYDRYYITHWSLGLDIRILFLTAWTVIRGDNAY